MELLATLLGLIGIHALFVSAEYAFIKTTHSDAKESKNNVQSIMSSAICRQLEDYLTVCALAKTIITMSMGVLFGFLIVGLGHNGVVDLSDISWRQWTQFGFGFCGILLVQLIVGFEIPKLLALIRTRDCTEALAWHLEISRMVLWPLLWLVNQLKRYATRFV